MGAVTYPDMQVAELLNHQFISVQVDIEKVSKLAYRYQAIWTPSLHVITSREQCIFREVGWLPPAEFGAMLQLAQGHFWLNRKKYVEATSAFKEVFERFPRSFYAPESLYFSGVSRYMASHEVDNLKDDWVNLQRFYPDSGWAIKSNLFN
jgi:hypothetical protein